MVSWDTWNHQVQFKEPRMLILNSDQLGGKKETDEINERGSKFWKTFAILIFVRKSLIY